MMTNARSVPLRGHGLLFMDTVLRPVVRWGCGGRGDEYLKEGDVAVFPSWNDESLGVDSPCSRIVVTETEPVFRAIGFLVPQTATMETGLVVQVPLFIEVGETLKTTLVRRSTLTRVRGSPVVPARISRASLGLCMSRGPSIPPPNSRRVFRFDPDAYAMELVRGWRVMPTNSTTCCANTRHWRRAYAALDRAVLRLRLLRADTSVTSRPPW